MNRQEYKEAAEDLLKKAEKGVASGFSNSSIEKYTAMARVYAMLAAIPDEQDTESAAATNAGTETLRDDALAVALGNVLQLADPDNPNVLVAPTEGGQNHAIRTAVRSYLLTWVAGPLADALLRRDLDAWRGSSPAAMEARAYLEGLTS